MDLPDNVRPGRVSSLISAYESLLKKNFKEVELEDDDKPEDDNPEVIKVTAIKVKKVALDIAYNTVQHHTDEFEITDKNENEGREFLVIRRGQTFNMKIEFNRAYNKEKDDLRLVFQFGANPLPNKGTHAEFMLSDQDVTNKWGAYIKSQDSKTISLILMTPPMCPVGKWRMNIDVVKQADNETNVFRYAHPDPIYILFNPWCEHDPVYFHEKEGEKLLNEYVLKETGTIFSGNADMISQKPWDFGQFSGNVLDCVVYLLDNSSLRDNIRGDPVLVSRKMTAMINSTDEDGVLMGNWSGNYSDGTSPLHWTGSVAIFEEYYKTKKPVCYGQCWVFSGLLTTACRALGIPTRSVTNFDSAHDTDGSVTIDQFQDSSGELLEELNGDSIWNFHCWNDAWMARPDLPAGYGGWQAIDSTPQEASGGVFCMGPTSLVATKRGEAYLQYDGKFVFAEVNADKVYWELNEDGGYDMLGKLMCMAGKNMSTLKPFSKYEREDVTEQYKFSDGSVENRAAVLIASIASSADREVYKLPTVEDVDFDLDTSKETYIGDSIEVSLTMKNTSTEDRTVNGTFKLCSMYYTGVVYKEIEKQKIKNLILKPNEEKLQTIKLTAEEYLDKLMDHCMCRVSAICTVKETKQVATGIKEIRLRKPHLDVKAAETGFVGQKFPVKVSFKNPLHVALTKCELRVEGAHLQRPIVYNQADVAKHEMFTGTVEMTPAKAGEREIIIYFNCEQIAGITASHEIKIEKK